MKIPEFIIIAGQAWKIRTDEVAEAELNRSDRVGECVLETNTIRLLTSGRNRQAVWETLLHEVTHVILLNAGLTEIAFKGPKQLEGVVTAVGTGLYQVLTDNNLWRGR